MHFSKVLTFLSLSLSLFFFVKRAEDEKEEKSFANQGEDANRRGKMLPALPFKSPSIATIH